MRTIRPSWNLLRDGKRYANAASHSDPEAFRERQRQRGAALLTSTCPLRREPARAGGSNGVAPHPELRAVTRIGGAAK